MEELKILQKTFDMMNYAYVGEDYRGQQKVL